MKPTIGETTIGMTTFSRRRPTCTVAPAASAAPTSPPIRAWEDDDGRPNHQVSRFQPIAPTSAAAHDHQARRCPCGAAMMPLPTVAATCRCRRTPPTRLATAAMTSATRGVSARVETEVAMALAASWKPLV